MTNMQIKNYERSKTNPLTKYVGQQNEEVYRDKGMELMADYNETTMWLELRLPDDIDDQEQEK